MQVAVEQGALRASIKGGGYRQHAAGAVTGNIRCSSRAMPCPVLSPRFHLMCSVSLRVLMAQNVRAPDFSGPERAHLIVVRSRLYLVATLLPQRLTWFSMEAAQWMKMPFRRCHSGQYMHRSNTGTQLLRHFKKNSLDESGEFLLRPVLSTLQAMLVTDSLSCLARSGVYHHS